MAEAAERSRTGEHDVPPPEAERHICTVTFCPICAAVTAGHAVRPDAVEHLLAAGREFLLALSSIIGARAEPPTSGGTTTTLTRIDVE
ncbi:MAG TPA: hypothetical protein VF108_12685 [Actinomycetota bacterium]